MPKLPKFPTSKRKDNPEARMSIGDHLRELRNRIIISAVGVLVCAVIGYMIYDWAFALVTYPVTNANAHGANLSINFATILGSFDMRIRVSLWLGLIISAPLWMYQFWAYVGPGMTRKERRYAWAYGVVGLLLFACGVALGVFLLPHAVQILTSFIPSGATSGFIDASTYLSFVMRIILVFGLAFLVPEIMVALNQLGLVKGRTLLKGWRWAVVIIFAFMALANPLPDPWSMIFMALPVTGLYFLACYIAIAHDKRVEKKRAALDAELDAALAEPTDTSLPPGSQG
ncbi:twin-arginine translocase subunit TatC [Actinomyces slackii]|uniref:Sec-independent protein translocase protein TatC n=1 Tax=Actinomyces slackii TaxID=52774 RepID=A0A3S5EMA2_9ACTO|nr:twin-arginine translocase subunit TatC [Actinomyces slackii]VEG75255.1 Sec-independent protein translocase protein TatCy [Actinomyces slackii]